MAVTSLPSDLIRGHGHGGRVGPKNAYDHEQRCAYIRRHRLIVAVPRNGALSAVTLLGRLYGGSDNLWQGHLLCRDYRTQPLFFDAVDEKRDHGRGKHESQRNHGGRRKHKIEAASTIEDGNRRNRGSRD
jgi:hypothetical protein